MERKFEHSRGNNSVYLKHRFWEVNEGIDQQNIKMEIHSLGIMKKSINTFQNTSNLQT